MIIKDDEVKNLDTPFGNMLTYIYRPIAEGNYPGLILFSDIFQATPTTRRIAAFFAGHGFIVIVPEIFHEIEEPGTCLSYLGEEGRIRGNKNKIEKEISSYDQDAIIAINYLSTYSSTMGHYCTGKIGVIGMSIGGHLAIRAAMNKEVLAGVCFYSTDIYNRNLGKGKKANTLERMKEIKGELLLIWGKLDSQIPQDGREVIYSTLVASQVNFQWFEFNSGHAFIRDDDTFFFTNHSGRSRYDPALSQICFSSALELFRRNLS